MSPQTEDSYFIARALGRLIRQRNAWRDAAIESAREVARLMHRPTDAAGITAAARDLAATGLKPRDIASALGLTEHAVSQLLSPPSKEIRNV